MTKLPEKCRRDRGVPVLIDSAATNHALWSLSLILGEISQGKEEHPDPGMEDDNSNRGKNSKQVSDRCP